MANQYTGKDAVAKKAETAQALSQAVQSPIRASDSIRATLKEELYRAENRKVVVEGIIMAFQAELQDEMKTIDAVSAALNILDESNRPRLVEKTA